MKASELAEMSVEKYQESEANLFSIVLLYLIANLR